MTTNTQDRQTMAEYWSGVDDTLHEVKWSDLTVEQRHALVKINNEWAGLDMPLYLSGTHFVNAKVYDELEEMFPVSFGTAIVDGDTRLTLVWEYTGPMPDPDP